MHLNGRNKSFKYLKNPGTNYFEELPNFIKRLKEIKNIMSTSSESITMKILVVHRQKETVSLIKSVLSRCNPVVRHTESGLDGLLTSRIEHFDLIICSTDLPVVTGFELIRSVRTHSVNRNTPVIFIADEINEKTQHLGNALGVAAMLIQQELSEKLEGVVTENVKPEPDKVWQELISPRRFN